MGSANVSGAAVAIESANSSSANSQNTVFHNNWPMVIFSYVFGVLAFIVAVCCFFLVIALAAKLRLHHLDFLKIYDVLQWAACTYYMIPLGWSLLKHGRYISHFQAKLDSRGVDFRLGTRKKPDDAFFAWDQIAAVHEKRSPGYRYYSVVAKNGDSMEFTSRIFLRSGKLAQEIARRASVPITEPATS